MVHMPPNSGTISLNYKSIFTSHVTDLIGKQQILHSTVTTKNEQKNKKTKPPELEQSSTDVFTSLFNLISWKWNEFLTKISFSMTEPFNRLYLTLEHVRAELNTEHLFNLRSNGKPSKPLCVSFFEHKIKWSFLDSFLYLSWVWMCIGQLCNPTFTKCQNNLCSNSKIRKINKQENLKPTQCWLKYSYFLHPLSQEKKNPSNVCYEIV